ncbi:Aste57867_19542 [Aphanomyces stellatus]|uniref:Aste57867_19542 protein n=1 Tax=Aphanomyces stellatus TaxID=120398 RepID=A0A485LDJ1_9STRA|nr:hypothetical protein As57867_019478 [Aphanomyces stellatus]VFT96249.1 Aste57867_19542 [Aphanomyces stellatus]
MTKPWSKKEKSRVAKRLYDVCKRGAVNELSDLLTPLPSDKISLLLHSSNMAGGDDSGGHLSCLHAAASANQPAVVDFLLTHYYEYLFTDARQDYARTPLHEAALAGHPDVAAVLVRHGALVSAHTTRGRTPLMYASRGGHVAVVALLLDAGAHVDDQSETGITALYEAAKHGRRDAALLLVRRGANVNLGSQTQHMPLHVAISEGHLDVAECLIEAGADTAAADAMGVTVWHEAAGLGTVAMALLLRHNVPLGDKDVDVVLARHPFHYAAVEGHAAFCAALLAAHMVDVNMQDRDGCTALYYASANGHADVLRVLLGADADPNVASTRRTALHCAVMWQRDECVRLLLAHGAATETLDKDGRSPRETAAAFPAIAALFDKRTVE